MLAPSTVMPIGTASQARESELRGPRWMALPAPQGDVYAVREYVPPSTPLETALAQLWSELLGVEKIGLRDNFFELGGYSILGLRLVSATRDTFGVDMTLRELFDGPTIEKMLEVIYAKVEEAAMEDA